MKRAISVLILLTVTGCAATHPFKAPDGRQGYAAVCDRNWQSMADCHTAAREACGGDYDIIESGRGSLEVACKSAN